MFCKTEVIIVEPPGVPTTIFNFPSFSTIVGVIELNILFSGAISLALEPNKPKTFGTFGFALKSSISLFRKNPAPFTKTLEPYPVFKVVVTETALPN